jgi:uncharacterized repeat protein (TIGR03803 family)
MKHERQGRTIPFVVLLGLLGALAAFSLSAWAQTFKVLHSFDGTEGSGPTTPLIQATDGTLYGTTYDGGAFGAGTLFTITPGGTLATLYSFCAESDCRDGRWPTAPLIQATDGNFYGTTYAGGASGKGTVFKITPSGTLTTLYSFCSQNGCVDGDESYGGLVQATDGNFYGTAFLGGAYGYGTIFKITPTGVLTTLHSFCAPTQYSCPDGGWLAAGLIQATDGNLYGTTLGGGAYTWGTVFRITLSGAFTRLYSFPGGTGGAQPEAPLIQGIDGNFYGTTYAGGASGGGTVFKITPGGTLTTLYSFCSQSDCADGDAPEAGLIQATDGNLYGATYGSKGSIFKLTLSGALTTMRQFHGMDGAFPDAALVQDTNGRFYGTTSSGGLYSIGTVFALSTGLAPFVETRPNHGKVGWVIQILGNGLGSATSVTFNGTPAVFEVIAHTLIGATVPAGATTGTVAVTTRSGVLSSNVPFRVIQ